MSEFDYGQMQLIILAVDVMEQALSEKYESYKLTPENVEEYGVLVRALYDTRGVLFKLRGLIHEQL